MLDFCAARNIVADVEMIAMQDIEAHTRDCCAAMCFVIDLQSLGG